ncbi:MAG: hypothetical protein JWM53_2727 [bacterium]|nr:hypothetical protein [bacterium]
MSAVAQRIRNAARFGSPVAPGERERAAETIESCTAALKFVRVNTNLCPIAAAAVDAALAKAEAEQ